MSAPRRPSNSAATNAPMAATMAHDRVMSGTGERASEKTPAVVTAMSPAVNPTWASNARRPTQYVPATRASPARSEGRAAVRWVTAPVGHAARAISHAWSGGLLSIGAPLTSGSSQCPRARISRAMRGNRVSSLVDRTCAPKSKKSSAALRAITTTHPRSIPAFIGQVVVAPRVEHQEAPEDLPVVGPARQMLADELGDRGGLEQATACDAVRSEALPEDVPERPAQPGRDGDPEALFPPVDEGGRKEVVDRALEEVLRHHSGPELEAGRDPAGQLDERGIEERSADLEPGGHGRAVGGDQRLVREIEATVLIDHALHGVAEGRVVDRRRELGVGIEGVQGVPDGRRQQARLLGWGEASEQELGPDRGLIGEPADELLEQEVDAPIAGGVRHLLHDGPGGALDRRGKEAPQPAGRPVSRKGRVAAEQLIAAVSAQDDGGGGAGRPRQRVPGQKGCVAERLVEKAAHAIHESERVTRREDDRVVLGPAVLGDLPGEGPFVVGGLLEAHAERLEGAGPARAGRDRRDRSRIDAPAQEDPEGHVAHHPAAHRGIELGA